MRLIRQSIEARTGAGSATLLPEDSEDVWHAYNLIRPGDLLRAAAVRRITTESGTGATSTQRVHTTLTLRVIALDFDPQAAALHVSGRVAEPNSYVSQGQHHTLDLELHRQFTLEKKDGWDAVAQEQLAQAVDPGKKASCWAVVMGEGLANIALITEFQTVLRQRIEVSIPKKRIGGLGDHDKKLDQFFHTLLDSLLRQMDGTSAKAPLLLASPGFTAIAFQAFIKAQGVKKGDKRLQELAKTVIVAHSSGPHLHTLSEVMKDKQVLADLSDTKYARETSLMERFSEMVRKDDGRAWYGPKEVIKAIERGAVGRGGGVLMISNALFRSNNVAERKKWVALVENVRDVQGGEVRIMSETHESGKRLEGLGGIAAILTYPIEDLDEDENENEDGEPEPEPQPQRVAEGGEELQI